MLVQPQGVRVHARQMSVFLAARLAGYLLFASLIWFAGIAISRSWSGRSWLFGGVQVLLAVGLLTYAAAWPHAHCTVARSNTGLVQIGAAPLPAPQPRPTGGAAVRPGSAGPGVHRRCR
jgi:hypothetical protein